jgi:hypothetical protein
VRAVDPGAGLSATRILSASRWSSAIRSALGLHALSGCVRLRQSVDVLVAQYVTLLPRSSPRNGSTSGGAGSSTAASAGAGRSGTIGPGAAL